jgi:hypothetical protein
MGAAFYTISAKDALLVIVKHKRRFKNRTTWPIIVADVTAMIPAIVVADIVIGTQFQR